MRLVQVAEEKSSSATVSWPSAASFFTRLDPTNPAPPVTSTRMTPPEVKGHSRHECCCEKGTGRDSLWRAFSGLFVAAKYDRPANSPHGNRPRRTPQILEQPS